MSPHPKLTAALLLGALVGTASGCSDCKQRQGSGSAFAGLLCGGEGTAAPEPAQQAASLCQPRAVMPQLFSLLDNGDPALAKLREAVKDIGTAQCLTPIAKRQCVSDDQCQVGSCTNGLCPCTVESSPLASLLGLTFSGLSAIADPATNPPEPGSVGSPGCLPPGAAAALPPGKRNKLCELRRSLDVLLQQNGGQRLIDDPDVKRITIALLDYLQGKPPFAREHYDLFTGLGRMAAANTATCDPAALWTLLDDGLGYLTPALATQSLGHLQTLLADPYTKQLLAQLNAGGGTETGRQSLIVLVHVIEPSILAAKNGDEVTAALKPLLDQVYNSSSFPDSFKNEVKAVVADTSAMLAPGTGILPPLQKTLACAASAPVRCADPASCTNKDDELLGALYDLLSLPQSSGGIDLSTLVGALKSLVTLDATGQTARTLRLIVESVKGSDDPTEPHDARDAVSALAKQALTADEGRKLVPAIEVLVQRQVLTELFSFLQDLLYKCTPPHQ